MASRTEKLCRRQHRKEKKRQRARSLGVARLADVLVVDPPGAAKMSEALWALVEPDWNLCRDEEAMQKLLTLGVIAWNAALMKSAQRMAFLESLAQTIELRQDFKQLVKPFILRKEQLFPHIQRPILSFELTGLSGGKPHLAVLSGLT